MTLNESEEALRQLLEKEPENIDALVDLGMILGRTDRQDEAITLLEKVLKLDSKNQKAHFELGFALLTSNQFEEAEKKYLELLEINSQLPNAWYNLAVIYNKQKKMEEAIHAYEMLLKLVPDDSNALVNLGLIYYEINDYQNAEEFLKKSLTIDSSNLLVYSNLGLIYENQEDLDAAKDIYWKAFEAYPYITYFLAQYYRLTGEGFYLPSVMNSQLISKTPINDKYEAVLIDNIRSRGNITYKYILFIRKVGEIEPKYYISLELSAMTLETKNKEIYFLCSFSEAGHANYGIFEDELTYDNFLAQGLQQAKMWIEMQK